MRAAIAGIVAGAFAAVILTRSKKPGVVQATVIDNSGEQEIVEFPIPESEADFLELPYGATADTLQAQPSAIPPMSFGIVDQFVQGVKNVASDVLASFGTKYDALIHQSAQQAGIDPGLLYRLLYQESRFRDDIITGKVKSAVGALGIAQFMPATAREWLGSESAALDPRTAIPGAAKYLAWLIRQFGGDTVKAVAAYNWGIGNVKKKGLAAAPAETRNYVAAITGETIA
jgi:soluble lytic murein transglycosylase-like protein